MKPIAAILAVALLTVWGLFSFSYGADAGEKERRLVLDTSAKYFPAYFSQSVDLDPAEAKVFVQNASKAFFSNAAVWPVKNGYVIYKASSPVTFVLPSRKIRSSDKTYDRLVGIPPSQLLKLANRPGLQADESFLKISVRRVPLAINDLIGILDNQTEDQFKAFLDSAVAGNVSYKPETLDALRGPFVRIKAYQTCIQQLDNKQLTQSIKADLINAGMKELASRDFEYLDFLPLTDKEAILLTASKADGTFLALSSVRMNGTCRYGGVTQYTSY